MLTSFPELQFKWASRGSGKFLTSCWAATKLLVHTECPYLENHRFIQRWVMVSLGKRIPLLFHILQNLLFTFYKIPHFTKNTQDSMTVSPRAVERPWGVRSTEAEASLALQTGHGWGGRFTIEQHPKRLHFCDETTVSTLLKTEHYVLPGWPDAGYLYCYQSRTVCTSCYCRARLRNSNHGLGMDCVALIKLLTFLCISFLVSKMEMVMVPPSQYSYEDSALSKWLAGSSSSSVM